MSRTSFIEYCILEVTASTFFFFVGKFDCLVIFVSFYCILFFVKKGNEFERLRMMNVLE